MARAPMLRPCSTRVSNMRGPLGARALEGAQAGEPYLLRGIADRLRAVAGAGSEWVRDFDLRAMGTSVLLDSGAPGACAAVARFKV